MTQVNLNTNLNTNALQQVNLQTLLGTLEAQTPLSPLLSNSANVSVTSGAGDLDALVAKLGLENSDARESITKSTLNSVLTSVITTALKNVSSTEGNLEANTKIAQYSKELQGLVDTVTVESTTTDPEKVDDAGNPVVSKSSTVYTSDDIQALDDEIASYQTAINEKNAAITKNQAKVVDLNDLLAGTGDEVEKAKILAQIADLGKAIDSDQNLIGVYQDKMADATTLKATIAEAAKTNTQKGEITTTREQVESLTGQKTALEGEISQLNTTIQSQQAQKATLTQQKAELDQELENLETQLTEKKKQLKNATDDKTKATLEGQIAQLNTTIAATNTTLANTNSSIAAIDSSIAANKTTLAARQASLATVQASLDAASTKLDTLNARKQELVNGILEEANNIINNANVTEIKETRKAEVVNTTHRMDDEKAERGEEEEKYLSAHSIVRIIQDAVVNHDREMLDDISFRREDRI